MYTCGLLCFHITEQSILLALLLPSLFILLGFLLQYFLAISRAQPRQHSNIPEWLSY